MLRNIQSTFHGFVKKIEPRLEKRFSYLKKRVRRELIKVPVNLSFDFFYAFLSRDDDNQRRVN